jgi:hypothetical protein
MPTMLGGGGMNSNTQVPVIMCSWAHVAMSCGAKH